MDKVPGLFVKETKPSSTREVITIQVTFEQEVYVLPGRRSLVIADVLHQMSKMSPGELDGWLKKAEVIHQGPLEPLEPKPDIFSQIQSMCMDLALKLEHSMEYFKKQDAEEKEKESGQPE